MNLITTVLAGIACCFGVALAQPQQQEVQAGPTPSDSAGKSAPFLKRVRAPRPAPPGIYKSLDSALKNVDSVIVLILRDNGLSTLPKDVTKMKNLRSIDLSGNKLTSFPAELLQLQSITSIDLSNNALKTITADLSKLPSLTRLGLKNTGISTLPVSIGACKRLTSLDISRNPLLSLPVKEINALPQLKTLIIGNPDPPSPEK